MKKYLVFTGETYYPSRGWGDFLRSVETEQEARELCEGSRYVWSHYVDRDTEKVVSGGERNERGFVWDRRRGAPGT